EDAALGHGVLPSVRDPPSANARTGGKTPVGFILAFLECGDSFAALGVLVSATGRLQTNQSGGGIAALQNYQNGQEGTEGRLAMSSLCALCDSVVRSFYLLPIGDTTLFGLSPGLAIGLSVVTTSGVPFFFFHAATSALTTSTAFSSWRSSPFARSS